ncbi:serine/threonine-protein kinase PAK 5 isoform X1 [Anopheles maculipalpis]|uniref:serine/threonine-protein kinase PAK 5 isoform X1 n=2 Tax=Anopheles maculipalpis TaxID=1496333 RepID=UPI00215989BA|nr:serine/threonine-protein kinase PAK 5 isoform X1 [Anopheles maculipalpis]
MASRVPHANEMSPTVQTEADIELAVAVKVAEVEADDRKEDRKLPGICQLSHGPGNNVTIVIDAECPNVANDCRTGNNSSNSSSGNRNNNSASMKCLNFSTSSPSVKGCILPTNAVTGTHGTQDSTLDSAKCNQFVNHSFSCRELMGTSGSVVVVSEGAAPHPERMELARGFADVVRVSTSVPQPVTIRCSEQGTATGTSFHYATAAAVAAVAMTAAAAAAAAVSSSSRPSIHCSSASGDGIPLPPPTLPIGEPMAPANNPVGDPVLYHPTITISDHNVDATTTTTTTNPNRTNPTVHEREDVDPTTTKPCDKDHHHHHHDSNPTTVVMPFVSTNVPLDADRCDETTSVPSSVGNHQYHHPFVTTTTTTTDATSVTISNAMPITNTVPGRCSKPPLHSYQQHYQSYHHHQQHQHGPPFSADVGAAGAGGGAVPMVAGGGTYRSHSARFMTQHIKILPKTQSLDLADNDDMLEASNRSESQLEISAAGIVPPGLKGRVLPKLQTLDQTSRPIYPNVPYSPYNSPYGSPRSGRRRTPLRESRRVSIEQSGSFLQLNQYKLLDQIGQGSYGLVKLAYSEEDSTHYAMKILSKRKLLRKAGLMRRGPKRGTSPLDRVYREIAVLKKLDHPNVVKLVEVLDDPLEDSLYLVFELVQQGEVLSIPTDTPLSEERAWNIFRDVLLGVEYLHYQRIIHGDLKPANLLLSDSGSVKVADLGVCNEFLGEDAAMNNGSTAGTPAFRAPETLLPGQHFYNGKAADIWALGATLFSLVHGNVPFIATSVPGVYEKIKNDPLEYPANSSISVELRDLINRMLDKDPQQRITLPQIKEHAWLTKNGSVQLPTEEENCRLVQINDEDMNSVVKSIPKLDTLILIKTMLKKHSFQNPFTKGISGRAPQAGGSRLERFCRSGRSNSAPGDYHTSERQPSNESLLPSVTEGVTSPLGSPDPTTGSLISELDSLTLRSDMSNASSSTNNDTTTTTTVKIITTPPE